MSARQKRAGAITSIKTVRKNHPCLLDYPLLASPSQSTDDSSYMVLFSTMAPKIIPKGTRNLPLTRIQRIIRLFYFTPLTVVLLERLWIPLEYGNLSGYLDVESTSVTKTRKVSKHGESLLVLPLNELTRSSHTWKSTCSSATEIVTNVVLPSLEIPTGRRIPKIVHQTSRSRCLTPAFTDITSQWKLPGHSYFFHDDEAINRLFRMDFPEFPQLKQVLRHCIKNSTIKADLWRYLILWVYGGVYADFDTAPANFNADTIKENDDGFFVVEQYHILSQWFMAVSPGHPLMFYAVQITLQKLLDAEDTLNIRAPFVSGPHALHAAFIAFRRDANVLVDPAGTGFKPVWSGRFDGTDNRTITVVGKGENENEYVKRQAVRYVTKTRDYETMGMTHFSAFQGPKAKKSGQSCHDAMLSEVMPAVALEQHPIPQ